MGGASKSVEVGQVGGSTEYERPEAFVHFKGERPVRSERNCEGSVKLMRRGRRRLVMIDIFPFVVLRIFHRVLLFAHLVNEDLKGY